MSRCPLSISPSIPCITKLWYSMGQVTERLQSRGERQPKPPRKQSRGGQCRHEQCSKAPQRHIIQLRHFVLELALNRRAPAYLPRGTTTTWPLTPKPPSGVSKISTNSLLAGSGVSFIAPRTTSVTLLIMAAF